MKRQLSGKDKASSMNYEQLNQIRLQQRKLKYAHSRQTSKDTTFKSIKDHHRTRNLETDEFFLSPTRQNSR